MIFRLVAIATYSILTYGVVNKPVIQFNEVRTQNSELRSCFGQGYFNSPTIKELRTQNSKLRSCFGQGYFNSPTIKELQTQNSELRSCFSQGDFNSPAIKELRTLNSKLRSCSCNRDLSSPSKTFRFKRRGFRPNYFDKSIPVKFKEERPKFVSEIDNDNMLQTDGIYLFGQSKQAAQIQNEYFVFNLKNGKVIGGFYLPHSAFYCFYGIHQQDSLQVKVIDTYDNSAADYKVDLQRYYRINQVSDNDFRILNTCQANYQYLVW